MTRFPAGPCLRQARIDAGLSVEEVALAVGRSSFTVHSYELGRVEPPLHVLSIIARMVGRTLDTFDVSGVAS